MPITDNTHTSIGTCSNDLHHNIGKTTESCLHQRCHSILILHLEVSPCLSKCCDNTGMTPPAAGLVKGSVFVVAISIHISTHCHHQGVVPDLLPLFTSWPS